MYKNILMRHEAQKGSAFDAACAGAPPLPRPSRGVAFGPQDAPLLDVPELPSEGPGPRDINLWRHTYFVTIEVHRACISRR